jgi:hypothetical protein
MGHPVIKPGLMFVGTSFSGCQYLYIVTKNTHKVLFLASSDPDRFDSTCGWTLTWYPNVYKEVKREDLPLYLNFYHGETFLRLMKGEPVI